MREQMAGYGPSGWVCGLHVTAVFAVTREEPLSRANCFTVLLRRSQNLGSGVVPRQQKKTADA